MKHFLPAVFLIVVWLNGFSQTFLPFQKERPAYYQFNSYDVFYQQAAIAIDSFQVNGSDTTYYHSSIIDYDNGNGCHIKAHDTSFVGISSIRESNGVDFFFNRNHDSIYFNNSSSLGQSWTMYHYPNGDVIKATAQLINEVSVLGVNDSVKTIILQAQDGIGNNISNIFNGKIFKVGKATGFVSGYSLFHFPEDSIGFSIVGIENPPIGLNTSELTPEKIFDFEVGDRFDHIWGWTAQPSMSFVANEIRKIVSKTSFNSGDSIVYGIFLKKFISSFQYPDYSEEAIELYTTEEYSLSNYKWLNKNPFNFSDLNLSSDGYVFLNESYYNSVPTVKIADNYSWILQGDDCLASTVANAAPIDKYAPGLGRAYSYGGDWVLNNYDTLVYYNKSGIEWGDSINWAALTGIHTISGEPSINIFPNPANDQLFLLGNFSSSQTHFTLMNSIGKEMKLSQLSNQLGSVSFDVHSLSPGLYVLQVKNKDDMVNLKFVKE